VPPLIDRLAFGGLIADRAFNSNAIIADLGQCGAKVVIAHTHGAPPLCPATPTSTNGTN
jgi:hypothetical protein